MASVGARSAPESSHAPAVVTGPSSSRTASRFTSGENGGTALGVSGARRSRITFVPDVAQPSVARRIAFAAAWFGLGASVLVHAASFFGVSLFEQLGFLHFGVFVLGIPAVFSRKNRQVRMNWRSPRESLRTLLDGAPPWAGRVLVLAWIYFALNMVALFVLGEGGTPEARDGRFILHNHGRLIRELTEAEYRWQLSHVSRMFSAGWALAYTFFLFWYWVPRGPFRSALGRSDRGA